jgi:Xaa-Pro aminopeptidase
MPDNGRPAVAAQTIPFDAAHLDRLMEAEGIDCLIASSKHNIQYLLGGHRSQFFSIMDALGLSRYLPLLVYPKGAPEKAAYIGHRLESHQQAINPFWTPSTDVSSSGSLDAMQKAVEHLRRAGIKSKHLGVELAFLPADAAAALSGAFSESKIVDALLVLERLRARKRPDELAKLRRASDLVIDSMMAVISSHGPGTTKAELVEALWREETDRGLVFDYCLITAGTSLNRAPSEQMWNEGDILSLDSGANYQGYIGDICRMAILGEPDAELVDLLAEIESIQRAAMSPIKAGALGSAIQGAARPLLERSPHRDHLAFLAHGMGLVSHEAPRLMPRGPVPAEANDAGRPLESGMVVSIETTLLHPRRGFIKLEDTVAVTDEGFEIYGEGSRGWNRGGLA